MFKIPRIKFKKGKYKAFPCKYYESEKYESFKNFRKGFYFDRILEPFWGEEPVYITFRFCIRKNIF